MKGPLASAAWAWISAAALLGAPAAGQPGAPRPGGAPPDAPRRATLPQPVEAMEGRPVARVTLRAPVEGKPAEFTPLTGSLEQLAQNQIRLAPGSPLRASEVADDISRLNRIGRFKSIRAEAQLLSDGSVELVYTLSEQPVIQDVQVVGNRVMSDQELLTPVSVVSGTPVDRFQIDRGGRVIEELYRTRGYYEVRVAVDEKVLADSSIVLYQVVEGAQVKVTGIRFEGNSAFTPRELRSQIKTTTAIPIIEKAPLDDQVLNEDVASLVNFYRDRGYLDARASVTVQPSPNGREAIVTFQVEEGPLYTLRSVRAFYIRTEDIQKYRAEVLKDPQAEVSYLTPEQMRAIGKQPFSSEQLSGLMVIKPGDVYSDDKMRKSLEVIRAAYGKLGHLIDQGARGPVTARIEPREVRDEKSPQIDLLLFIDEGTPFTTGEVTVIGNPITKQQVILRQVQVRPERPLDKTALDETRKRLEELRLFDPRATRVTVQPPRPGERHRDVLIEVEETNTGEVNLGAAVGSDAGVVGRLGVKQRNFDLFDTPESIGELLSGRAFRGAGQTADLEILPGTTQQNYLFTLTEPYLLESNYSASGTALYQVFDRREYTEERYGGRFGLGRRFGSVWRGELLLRNEWVQLSDIDDDAPADYFDSKDLERLSGIGVQFTRNTTDNRLRPSRGSRLEFGAEQVGVLGGGADFSKLRMDWTGFYNVYESFLGYRTILKLDHRMAYIPQGQDAAPVYERFFLGGQSFRGFNYRTISPVGRQRDGTPTDEPVGGTWEFFLGAELNQPVYQDIVSLVGFVDSGTVESRVGFSDYRVSVGVGVRVLIKQLSPVPLAFDFGFPVMKQDTDRERVFTFSVDVPF